MTAVFVAGCSRRDEPTVDARDYRAFFLWPGVTPPPWLRHAQEVYVLAGEVRHGAMSGFQPLRATPAVPGPILWLVVRVERLDWQEMIYHDVLRTLAIWQARGNHVEGLQIDFDSATRGLAHYAAFLAGLRARLPRALKLSITGLMDWSVGGEPGALRDLAHSVDEIVVQTYQGRKTLPGYTRYLAGLGQLQMPYRIALLDGGEWQPPEGVAFNPNFRGYVVFLQESKRR